MPHKRIPRGHDQGARPSDGEYTQFAQKFVNLMLQPDYEWLRHYFLTGGFTYPIGSVKQLAFDIVGATERDFFAPKETADAVLNRDHEKLDL
jgi:hypothetical protein